MTERETWHGTAGGYNNHHCRCAACREAWRLSCMDYRRRRGVRPASEYQASRTVTHGIRSSYAHGCRCEDCQRAEREYRRLYRLAARG